MGRVPGGARHGPAVGPGRHQPRRRRRRRHGRRPAADAEHRQRLRAVEDPARYGWLAAAGFAVDVIDKDDLLAKPPAGDDRYHPVLLQTPTPLSRDEQARLHAVVDDGGAVVTVLAAPESAPRQDAGAWHWPTKSRRGQVTAELPGFAGCLDSAWDVRFLDAGAVPDGVDVIPHERTALGGRGRAAGNVDRRDRVAHVYIRTNVIHRFNTAELSTPPGARLRGATDLARALLRQAGERPLLDTDSPRVLCTPRVAPERLFLFVENDCADATRAHLSRRVDDDSARFGLQRAQRYVLRDALNGRALGERTGAALLDAGSAVDVHGMGTAVAVVTPA